MDRPYLPPAEFLRECFLLDEATGVLTWRHRPDHHFPDPKHADYWNRQHAGQVALASPDRGGYLRGSLKYQGRCLRVSAHRVMFVMLHGYEPDEIDHADGDKANNRPSNLRPATAAQNTHNQPTRLRKNGWLPKGVTRTVYGKFRATGHEGVGQKANLGTYKTPAEAHEAWKAWARQHHGEFFNPGPERLTIFD